MPPLEGLYRVHQRACVDRLVSGNVGVRREIAEEPEQSHQPWDAGIGVARGNRSLHQRELLPVIFLRQLHVGLQRLHGAPVTRIRRLHVRQRAGNVDGVDHMVFEKFCEIVFLGFIVESECEVLRIHFADVEIGANTSSRKP